MNSITTHNIGIVMNGVTGRMGTNQHLLRSIVDIIKQGGIRISDTEIIMPDPILVGRNTAKLDQLARMSGVTKLTTSLDKALDDPVNIVYFDAQTTPRRFDAVKKAILAGKHVYCEKPSAHNARAAYELYQLARDSDVKHGVVQDKLWLPGLLKLKKLREADFFGEIISVRGEFGYWVFAGDPVEPQRPSWNYRKEEGGGIILDMLCHWRYILDNLFGEVKAVSCLGATHVKQRRDENGNLYQCTADDAAYTTFQLENGIIAHINSSWCVRVRRDDLLTLQVDGTRGTAVAGLRNCWIQPYDATPRPVWNPDIESPKSYFEDWRQVPNQRSYDNAFKAEWELFLRHVVQEGPFRWNLLEGAKGVQLAEKGLESWQKRAWVDVPPLEA